MYRGETMYYKVDNELKEIESLDNVSEKDDVVILLTLEQWHEACHTDILCGF